MKKSFSVVKHCLAPVLSYWLCFSLAFAQSLPSQIVIVVIEGEGASNQPGQRAEHPPAVRIEDENHHPVEGAAVVFTLPIEGPSGEFSNGSKTMTVVTDGEGLAAVKGLKANTVGGKLQIYVTASYRGLRARNLINQVNLGNGRDVHKSGSSKVWVILALVGAAAAGGAVAATHKSGSTSTTGSSGSTPTTPTAIGITPGTGTITAPH